MIRFEPIVQIANEQLLSLAVNFELFSPHEYEIEKCQITTSKSLIGFLKKSGLHDYSRQSKASPNKRNIPLLLIKKDKILKIKLSVFRKTDQNGTAAFWPMSNSNFIQANDVCAFISYFNYLILINYSKVSKKYIGQTLNKLGISN